jgi:hypothetical protein
MPVNVPVGISLALLPGVMIARRGFPTLLMVTLSAPPMIVSTFACP